MADQKAAENVKQPEPQVVVKKAPEIRGVWKNGTWEIEINDDGGKSEISPRQRNLFLLQCRRRLLARYRKHRVASYSGKPENV